MLYDGEAVCEKFALKKDGPMLIFALSSVIEKVFFQDARKNVIVNGENGDVKILIKLRSERGVMRPLWNLTFTLCFWYMASLYPS